MINQNISVIALLFFSSASAQVFGPIDREPLTVPATAFSQGELSQLVLAAIEREPLIANNPEPQDLTFYQTTDGQPYSVVAFFGPITENAVRAAYVRVTCQGGAGHTWHCPEIQHEARILLEPERRQVYVEGDLDEREIRELLQYLSAFVVPDGEESDVTLTQLEFLDLRGFSSADDRVSIHTNGPNREDRPFIASVRLERLDFGYRILQIYRVPRARPSRFRGTAP
jgi:hypothetical protein